MNAFDLTDLADIHNHLVPGVDDGARCPSESLRHLQALAAAGVTRLAVSPHLDARIVHEPGALDERLNRLETAFQELDRLCGERDDVPDLVFGQEILVPDPDTARKLFREPRVGYAGTRYALIEFGFDLGEDPLGVVRSTLESGRRAIIAHPERYRRNGGRVGLDEIRGWKEAGGLLQLNGGSVLGGYGDAIAELAWRLLDEGLIDLIGTDHHADARPVSPRDVGNALARRGLDRQARALLSENPRRVLEDRDTLPIAAAPPRPGA